MIKNIVPAKDLLVNALSKKIAIGAFNFTNMEIIQAIVEAANEMNTPVILQASESAIKYMGINYVIAMIEAASKSTNVPLALHLDHGKDFDICCKCIDAGFSSVMIDKSSMSFEENIEKTKEVVEYAKKKGVSVEAELGTLAGIEDEVNVELQDALYTNPDLAYEFAEKTGIDSLAVAIGTSHGPNKGKLGSPRLDIERLTQIKAKVGELPLVLHGASSVYQDDVDLCNQYGADIKDAFGITDSDIKKSIQNGIAKINVDTDIRIAFLGGVRKSLSENISSIDMRKYLGEAKKQAKLAILRKIKSFIS